MAAALGLSWHQKLVPKGKGVREVADMNFAYLRDRTRYLSKAEIVEMVSPHFDNLTFAEKYMVKYSSAKLAIFILSSTCCLSARLYTARFIVERFSFKNISESLRRAKEIINGR